MTFEEYKLLNKEDQYILWLSRSIQVASYDEEDMVYLLYQLDNFYVEVKFFKNSFSSSSFQIFTNTGFLTPYIERIDISELFISQ